MAKDKQARRDNRITVMAIANMLAAIVDAMRTLLTNDVEHARLVAEIAEQRPKTWRSYADEIWTAVTA